MHLVLHKTYTARLFLDQLSAAVPTSRYTNTIKVNSNGHALLHISEFIMLYILNPRSISFTFSRGVGAISINADTASPQSGFLKWRQHGPKLILQNLYFISIFPLFQPNNTVYHIISPCACGSTYVHTREGFSNCSVLFFPCSGSLRGKPLQFQQNIFPDRSYSEHWEGEQGFEGCCRRRQHH